MGSMICMNEYCATAAPAPAHEWTQGWPLRSGGIAYLCAKCGSAYKNSSYCDLFHQDETGWRECRYCGKRLHCGCIASSSLLELVDFGGVMCINCSKSRSHPSTSAKDRWNDQESSMHLHKFMADEPKILLQTRKNDTHAPVGELEQESMSSTGKAARSFSNAVDPTFGSSKLTKLDDSRLPLKLKNIRESLPPPSLNISLASQGVGTNVLLPFSSGAGEGSQGMGLSSLHQGPRSRPILPKLRKSDAASPETTKLLLPPLRIARPPAEGRGKNQLLPRYWPRITDQELQQLSGDLNSTIEPLFEKVLSASDAGRIGRLVLPKACAEAYFPPISQSEGIPLRIQDAQGNEWTFQFRFWPNNNSRMYVLEGVTPCIQAMQLQAGDTVIFSRRDPGGKLVMGFRKASNSSDSQVSIVPNVGDLSREGSFQTFMGSPPAGSGYPGLIHTVSGTKDPQPDLPSELVSTADGDINWQNTEDTLSRTCEYSAQQSLVISEKKRTRNIGSKSRRMLIRSEDVLELRLTWEEAQDLLQPPPNVKPSLVTIEGHVFEEYDEPPVFGKRTIFVGKLSGGQEQWVQCDHCSKWRKLPVDVHLPPKWTCSDNVWDTARRSCSAPEEVSPEELESLFILRRDAKRQRVVEEHEKELGNEMSGLDALASAAVLGEGVDDVGEPSSGATTRHPRHRPGCTCIVCIQPPSGKGKHKPTCTCNVCMTVKRRFKTMMLRKKKRQSEREAGATQKCRNYEIGHDEAAENVSPDMNNEKNEGSQSQSKLEAEDIQEKSSGHIDLNCHPEHETRQQLEGHCLKSTSFT